MMKICNSEAMKLIKELEERERSAVFNETKRSRVSYKEGETKTPLDYDYAATRGEISAIDGRIRKIKHALAVANCTVKLQGFDITVGEGLVYLAQLNAEYHRLVTLSESEKLTRRITPNGVLEYTECLYDPDEAERDKNALYSEICRLQVAIDRANLTNEIEVDEARP